MKYLNRESFEVGGKFATYTTNLNFWVGKMEARESTGDFPVACSPGPGARPAHSRSVSSHLPLTPANNPIEIIEQGLKKSNV